VLVVAYCAAGTISVLLRAGSVVLGRVCDICQLQMRNLIVR